MTPRRRSRAGERGFTLVEMLVCLALLALVGTVMGVVFSVGIRAIVAPGASKDRLTAASDAIAVQQILSTDVQRATCIALQTSASPDPSSAAPGPFGSCAHEPSPFQGECPSASDTGLLCLEWPDLTTADQCDVVVYTLGAQQVTRTTWLGGTSAGAVSYPVVVTPGAVVTPSAPSTPEGTAPAASAGAWPVELGVTVTSANAQLTHPPSVSLDLQPLATVAWPTDPVSGTSTGPC